MDNQLKFESGQKVSHSVFGNGVIVAPPVDGYAQVFFATGERRVPISDLFTALDRSDQIVQNAAGGEKRANRAWLSYKAHALPLLDGASSLTSARIDLLPHQVVLTHRVATNSPRRYIIADEVGLGKTIEVALILRELASRSELSRALMVVPAGLVNNWHRELNEVFNLGFEVFGSQGDVTDRRSNAFQKHDRLIVSIDTLKRKARVQRLKEAPGWDLVVFDEGHHLTANRVGSSVRKTENYKLAEVLKDLTRDLIILSATPHQGDHFRFWMIVQLLDPTLFNSAEEMVHNRHRLNAVVFRRTKADACRSDGSPLFARRLVHTESFIMSDEERAFYAKLTEYLTYGFALAKRQGGKGQALGFLMAIFQKIAASSFAAVHRTLRRRLLALTVQEGLVHDENLDIEQREAAYAEAKQMLREDYGLSNNLVDDIEVESLLTDIKRNIVKKINEEELAIASSEYGSEMDSSTAEGIAYGYLDAALPEERSRIKELLRQFPSGTETKVQKLVTALGALWKQDPKERVVIFATYLGSVDMLSKEIDRIYPGQGVVVLKGGDHGSKLAAEKRFKAEDGPRVMICTAAGREGINLQHARVLFNFDLPWNPMDIEQRIGRIHRYGQVHTAQVYNLVLSDTIEGKIFLLLDKKLQEIAKTLGKVDEQGQVAEDLRFQILGQLSERLNYERLYSDALSDPELERTELEIAAAFTNASEARIAVAELFQDLDGFSLDDYQAVSDSSVSIKEITTFLQRSVQDNGGQFIQENDGRYAVSIDQGKSFTQFTINREEVLESDNVDLIGLDHPLISEYVSYYRDLPPTEIGLRVRSKDGETGVLSLWRVEAHGRNGETRIIIFPLAVNKDGKRIPEWESIPDTLFSLSPAMNNETSATDTLQATIEPMVQRELQHRGSVADSSYDLKLIGWVEVV